MNRRPVGVTILAVLQLIGGIVSVVSGLVALSNAGAIAPQLSVTPEQIQTLGSISLVLGIVSLIVSYGLFTLKGWAWLWTVILQGVGIVQNVLALIQGQSILGIGIAIAIAVLILYYLTRPDIKRAFGR